MEPSGLEAESSPLDRLGLSILDTLGAYYVCPMIYVLCDHYRCVRGREGKYALWCSEDEERLVRDLFRDYNKLIRPVEAMNQTVVVEFGLSFIQLINVVSTPFIVFSF
ncbi:hypothetical protein AVEN_55610-1 [Araneus ventricosus]|uniref:Neurotransmitter-gated ion-channel ligand-binding domain-containing protein n=1 Tax=Araneus ventricosus TaxID=182803 RepID=A0A4Y2R7L8_ARAVE|nr:hypothetical protein AVEN_55610-1 [Araneus ventricosus]